MTFLQFSFIVFLFVMTSPGILFKVSKKNLSLAFIICHGILFVVLLLVFNSCRYKTIEYFDASATMDVVINSNTNEAYYKTFSINNTQTAWFPIRLGLDSDRFPFNQGVSSTYQQKILSVSNGTLWRVGITGILYGYKNITGEEDVVIRPSTISHHKYSSWKMEDHNNPFDAVSHDGYQEYVFANLGGMGYAVKAGRDAPWKYYTELAAAGTRLMNPSLSAVGRSDGQYGMVFSLIYGSSNRIVCTQDCTNVNAWSYMNGPPGELRSIVVDAAYFPQVLLCVTELSGGGNNTGTVLYYADNNIFVTPNWTKVEGTHVPYQTPDGKHIGENVKFEIRCVAISHRQVIVVLVDGTIKYAPSYKMPYSQWTEINSNLNRQWGAISNLSFDGSRSAVAAQAAARAAEQAAAAAAAAAAAQRQRDEQAAAAAAAAKAAADARAAAEAKAAAEKAEREARAAAAVKAAADAKAEREAKAAAAKAAREQQIADAKAAREQQAADAKAARELKIASDKAAREAKIAAAKASAAKKIQDAKDAAAKRQADAAKKAEDAKRARQDKLVEITAAKAAQAAKSRRR
jgi:hypothetical protein